MTESAAIRADAPDPMNFHNPIRHAAIPARLTHRPTPLALPVTRFLRRRTVTDKRFFR